MGSISEVLSGLLNRPINDIVAIDTEFRPRIGEPVIPVCLCAESIVTGKTWSIWYGMDAPLPFPTSEDVLFVTFSAPAEWSYFLSAGWKLPVSILDLYAEFRLKANGKTGWDGKPIQTTLLNCCSLAGLKVGMSDLEKDSMRDVILRGDYTEEEKSKILKYCSEDVSNTAALFKKVIPTYNSKTLQQALLRGSYTRVVAACEFNGIPLDLENYDLLKKEWPSVLAELVQEMEAKYQYGCYEIGADGKAHFSEEGFNALIRRMKLARIWPKTKTGNFSVADKEGDSAFKSMSERFPILEPLREMRKLVGEVKTFELPVGSDGRVRSFLWPWSTKTGRNAPKRGFIFALPKCLRSLIKPAEGFVLGYADLTSAEVGIAAGLSNDPKMKEHYSSKRDLYLALAKSAGCNLPEDATKETHPKERKLFKTALLASQYGQTAWGLAPRLGISEKKAKEILESLEKVYRKYYAWNRQGVIKAQIRRKISTPLGWAMSVNSVTKPNTLANFQMQASCADIMRVASVLMFDRRIKLCALVHDAVLFESPIEFYDRDKEIVKECWVQASKIVLNGYALRSDCGDVFYPNRYEDIDGVATWDRIQALLQARKTALVLAK